MATVGALCLWCARARGEERLVEADLSHLPVELVSRGKVFTWELEGVRVFAAPEGGEVRQGDTRLWAPRLVVWLDEARSVAPGMSGVIVRVYGEGRGEAGKKPVLPATLVRDGTPRKGAFFYLRLRSKLAFTWNCPLVRDVEPRSVRFYVKAARLTRDQEPDAWGDLIPREPPYEWKKTVTYDLRAEEMYIFTPPKYKTTRLVYMGDVRGVYGNIQLNADVAVVWVDPETGTYEIYARGNVRVSRRPGAAAPGVGDKLFVLGAEHLRADEVYILPDSEEPKGLATDAELRFMPPESVGTSRMVKQDVYVIQGREVKILDSHSLQIREGSFSTDPFGHPHYKITGERVRVLRHDPSLFVHMWQPRLRTGANETTWPGPGFLGRDLASREGFLLSDVAVGNSSKFGLFVKTLWRPTHLGWDAPWIKDWSVNLDYYGDRGPAVGTTLQYGSATAEGPQHEGQLLAYYVNDQGSKDDTGFPVPQTNRGILQLQHRTRWNERWRTDAELYYLSDEGFLDEYFEAKREEEKQPESYILTRYRKDHLWLGLLIKERVNNFLSQTREYSAEAQWIGVPVGGLVYNAWVEGGVYDLEPSDKLLVPDPPALLRLHTEHRVAYPFNAGPVRVDPFVRFLVTYASRSLNVSTPGFGGSVIRVGGGGGVRASMEFTRSYDVASEQWGLNRLRHIMTPYVQLEAMPLMSADSAEFIQHDLMDPWRFRGSGPFPGGDRVDAIDKRYEARFGLRQRLQTKRKRADGAQGAQGAWRSVNWADLDVAAVFRSDDSVAVPVDDSFIEADMHWRVAQWLTLHSVDNRVSLGNGLDMFNVGAAAVLGEYSDLRVDFDYLTGRSALIRSALRAKLSDRYGLIVQEKFDLNANGSQPKQMETLVLLRRFFHKWVLDVGVQYDRGDSNFAIVLAFSPLELATFGGPTPQYESY